MAHLIIKSVKIDRASLVHDQLSKVEDDIIVNISNISLNVCAADDVAPEIACINSDELLVNGDFSDVTAPGAFPAPADFANWVEFGDVFDDFLTLKQTAKIFGTVSGVYQDAPVVAGEWLCANADIITTSLDNIVGDASWAEIKIEFYDVGGVLVQDAVLDDYDRGIAATVDVWTKFGGCVQAPENAVTARVVIIFLNFANEQGSIGVDNVSMQKINPTYFEANADGCTANANITNPVPTDECEVVTFTNTFNGTADASGNYPQGMTLVTYTAVDANGNESCCSILVEVGDMSGPVVDCPANIGVQLEPGECEELVLFDIPFSDVCGFAPDVPAIVQTERLPSGSYYPMGTTTNTFIVTDINGNETVCAFDVTLVEFSNGVTGVMSCNDNINVSLDMDCEVVLGADMLLEGNLYGCYDDYEIAVSGGVAEMDLRCERWLLLDTILTLGPLQGSLRDIWRDINVSHFASPAMSGAFCLAVSLRSNNIHKPMKAHKCQQMILSVQG